MPIIRKTQIVLDREGRNIRSVHRWAILFGIITPMALLLLVVLNSRDLFGIWPSLFVSAYEQGFYYGWAGMFAFGLLAFFMPELRDTEPTRKDLHVLHVALALYGLGVAATLAHTLSVFYGLWGISSPFAGLFAALIQCAGWLLVLYQVASWIRRDRRPYHLEEWLYFIGLGLFTVAMGVQVAVRLWFLLFDVSLISLSVGQALRVMPLIGAGFVTAGFVLRMLPELLGWRPLPSSRLNIATWVFLASALLILIAFSGFRYTLHPAWGIAYMAGAGGVFFSIAALLLTSDVLHVRLAPSVNREHVLFIYGSLFWLLVSVGVFFVSSVWEFVNKQLLHAHWSEANVLAFFAGFVGLGLIGVYTYWINQLPYAHQHRDSLIVFAFVIWNWVLPLRVFVYPLTMASAWPGAYMFRWVLDAALIVALLFVSLDMYDGLIGKRWFCFRKTCRR